MVKAQTQVCSTCPVQGQHECELLDPVPLIILSLHSWAAGMQVNQYAPTPAHMLVGTYRPSDTGRAGSEGTLLWLLTAGCLYHTQPCQAVTFMGQANCIINIVSSRR